MEPLKYLLTGLFVPNMVSEQKSSSNFNIESAVSLWKIDNGLPALPTFSQNIDRILDGEGIKLGTVTELLGLSGSGKTQFCLQLCAAVQIPKSLEGLEAECLYVDTNTNFSINRFKEIVQASHLKYQDLLGKPRNVPTEELLNRLHYIDAFGLANFCAAIQKLPQYISDHPDIKLIVIDSITFPFKQSIDEKHRTRLLFQQMAEMQRIAIEKQIAIVITNEMSTRVGLSGNQVVGAGGDSWAHRCNTRIMLSQYEGHRLAAILKSNNSQQAVAAFQITEKGIRDV